MDVKITVLTKEEIEERYSRLGNTKMARLTTEAVEKGYSIGLLEYVGLSEECATDWFREINNVLASECRGKCSYKIGNFTDLALLDQNKLYFAFKTKEETRFVSGKDDEGYIYNC